MADAQDIKDWLKRDLRYFDWDRDTEVLEETGAKLRLRIYTDVHCYAIIANSPSQGSPGGYLGCQGSSRKPRAGEDWTRGNDLPDGPLSEETWHDILGGIVGFEVVKVHRRAEPTVFGIPADGGETANPSAA